MTTTQQTKGESKMTNLLKAACSFLFDLWLASVIIGIIAFLIG